METKVLCPTCEGRGHVYVNFSMREKDIDPPDCGECAGYGWITESEPLGPDPRDNSVDIIRIQRW